MPLIIVVSFLPADGMALYPLILIKKKTYRTDWVLIRHEQIHLRQQLEMLVLPFYVVYLLNYVVNLLRFRNHDRAYQEILFEKESYGAETNADYLSSRPFWAWLGHK